MQKISFQRIERRSTAYTCYEPGDVSGWYYPSTDVDEAIHRLTAENESLRKKLADIDALREEFQQIADRQAARRQED